MNFSGYAAAKGPSENRLAEISKTGRSGRNFSQFFGFSIKRDLPTTFSKLKHANRIANNKNINSGSALRVFEQFATSGLSILPFMLQEASSFKGNVS